MRPQSNGRDLRRATTPPVRLSFHPGSSMAQRWPNAAPKSGVECGSKLVDIDLNSVELISNLVNIGPRFLMSAPCWPHFGRTPRNLLQNAPRMVNIGTHLLDIATTPGPNGLEPDRTLPTLHGNGPGLAELGPDPLEIGQIQSRTPKNGRGRPKFGRDRVQMSRSQSKIGRHWSQFGRIRANSGGLPTHRQCSATNVRHYAQALNSAILRPNSLRPHRAADKCPRFVFW